MSFEENSIEVDSISKKKILNELMTRQRKNIPIERKLQYRDMCRIIKYIDSSILGQKCCVWTGYITNLKNASKGTYINFYFRNKKVALHRLLYKNYVGDVSDDDYLKFSCGHKGVCCNTNHMIKYTYINPDQTSSINNTNDNNDSKKSIETENTYIDPNLYTLSFD